VTTDFRPLDRLAFWPALRSGFLLVFSALALHTVLQQIFEKRIQSIISSPEGLTPALWGWALLSLILAFLIPLFLALATSFYISRPLHQLSVQQFLREHFEPGLIETLRAWGKSMLWFFVFIVPGFVFYFLFSLSPYVVAFSRRYSEGLDDALSASRKLIGKRPFYYLWLFLFFNILFPLLSLGLLDEYKLFERHWLTALLAVAFEGVVLFYFQYLLLRSLFQELAKNEDLKYVTHV
jgi:hypothetical protein